jgi:recombination protein RecT
MPVSTALEPQTAIEKRTFMQEAINRRIESLQALLPPDHADQAPRLINVAMLYFMRDEKLQDATPASFIQCLFDSVSAGIPLDGKLGHAVVFNCKVKPAKGPEYWEKRVKFMPDFKGIVSVARRTSQIADAQSGLVYSNDHWKHGRVGPELLLEHTPADGDRGKLLGVYCILTFHDKPWSYEYMVDSEVQKVRASSKAKDDGPWVNWYEQMARKTVLKRALKTYCDDPQLLAAMRADDDWHEGIERREARVQRSSITTLPAARQTAAIAGDVAAQQEHREQAQRQIGSDPGPSSDEPPADFETTPTDPKLDISNQFEAATSKAAADGLKMLYVGAAYSPEIREHAEVCYELTMKRFEREKKVKPGTQKQLGE